MSAPANTTSTEAVSLSLLRAARLAAGGRPLVDPRRARFQGHHRRNARICAVDVLGQDQLRRHPVFMMRGVPWALNGLGFTFPAEPPRQFIYLTLATLALAALSWHVYERPLNDLKRLVTYEA